MPYEFHTRVRYSECDEKGYATMEALTCYLQDCCIFHSEDVGLSVDWFASQNRAWLLMSWQLDVMKRPKLGERICIGTIPYGMRGVLGHRSFQITGEDGEVYLHGDSVWCLIDTQKQSPVKVDDFYGEKYHLGERISVREVSKRIHPEGEFVLQEPVLIHRHHLDTNHHVNNSEYIRMALEAAGEPVGISMLRVEYKNQAFLGDLVYPKKYDNEHGCIVSLENEEGTPYAIVEITMEK